MQVKRYWQVRIDGKLSIMQGGFLYGRDKNGRVCRVAQIKINPHFYVAGRTLKTSGYTIEFIKEFELYYPTAAYDPDISEHSFLQHTTESKNSIS